MSSLESYYEPNDIVLKSGAARMFGVEGEGHIVKINHLMKNGTIPPYDFYLGARGGWRRQTLRDARDTAVRAGSKLKASPSQPPPTNRK